MADVLLCSRQLELTGGERLAEIAPGLRRVFVEDLEPSDPAVQEITLAYLSNDLWPNGAERFFELAAAAGGLRWMHIMFAGTDAPIFGALRRRGVRLTTSAGASAPAIAETVIMFISALSRGLPESVRAQEVGEWNWHRWRPMRGRTVAVVGHGPVGQHVIEATAALGMEPVAVRRRPRGDERCPVRTLDELPTVCAASDVVVLALPLTDDTRGVMSRAALAAMKPDALFINVARGQLVDQTALTEALAEKRIGGAGLDVFAAEPLDPDDPLWSLPNVIITPHNAGASTDAPERVFDLFCDNLERWIRQRPMINELEPMEPQDD